MKKIKPKIIAIVGPTASGKSLLAVRLAKKINGEIISADSRQVYKNLDIGTGKITKKEMQGIPHHLLDIASPKRQITVQEYKQKADKIIQNILKRNKIPIICGGTGFYIQAVIDNITFPDVPPNFKLRNNLKKKTPQELFTLLKKLDPKRAQIIDNQNPRRLIRAIEIAKALGKVPDISSELKYKNFQIGIDLPDKELKKKIHIRLLTRINSKKNMVQEAQKLHKNGLSYKRMHELGLEYRYLAFYLQKKITKQELIQKLETEIWHYAKRQKTWFKRDLRIWWTHPKHVQEITTRVKKFLSDSRSDIQNM